MRTAVFALVALVLVPAAWLAIPATALAAPTHFVFQVPPGWTDLTPGVPEANYAGVPPEVVTQIKKSAPTFFAADVAAGAKHGGFMTNVNGSTVPGASAITKEVLDAYQAQLAAAGAKYDAKERQLDDWNGVTVGVMTGELTVGGRAVAQVAYVIPGDGERAFLTFSTMPDELASYRPVFEAAARATRGAAQPVSFLEKPAVRGTILGFIGAVIALAVAHRARRARAARIQSTS